MDNLTHSLIGAGLANAGLKQKLGRGTTWALVISSNLPDLDVFWGFVDPHPSFFYRRMFTHGIIGVPLLSLVGAAIHRRVFPNLDFRTCFRLYLLGTVFHVLFDLANSFGVVVLYPFSRHRFELSWLFIIDLALWFFLMTPLLLSLVKSRWTSIRDLSLVALQCVTIYVMACAFLHHRSLTTLRRVALEHQMTPSFLYAFPEAFGPQRFRGVIRDGQVCHVYRVDAVHGRAEETGTFETHDGDPDVKRILETKEGSVIAWFAKAPVWTPLSGNGGPVRRWGVADLRFGSTVIHLHNPFVYAFDVTDTGARFIGRLRAAADRP